MPRKIPLLTMRSWLESYEKGQSEASIARKAKRDVRTVMRGIEQARREQDIRSARAQMIRDALQKHQSALAEALEQVIPAVSPVPADFEPLGRPPGSLLPILLPQATASHKAGEVWLIKFNAEDSYAWELLSEHLKRDAEWKLLTEWKRRVAFYIQARVALERRIATLLRDKTGLEIGADTGKTPSKGYLYPVVVSLLYRLLVPGQSAETKTNKALQQLFATADPYVRYGKEDTPVCYAPGGAELCRIEMLRALAELQGIAELQETVTSRRAVEALTTKTRRALEELSALGLIPGHCRVCRRLGI